MSLGVVDGAGADDHEQARVGAGETVLDGLPPLGMQDKVDDLSVGPVYLRPVEVDV